MNRPNSIPEPELNVGAELPRMQYKLLADPVQRVLVETGGEPLAVLHLTAAIMEAQRPVILAFLQQVSDQRVGAFAARLKTKAVMGRAGEKPDPWVHKIIDQTLADHLSHKEARDGK